MVILENSLRIRLLVFKLVHYMHLLYVVVDLLVFKHLALELSGEGFFDTT